MQISQQPFLAMMPNFAHGILKSWKNLENNALSSLHKLHVTEPADPGTINAKTTLHSYPEPEF
jgi:hypothetical protein